MKIKDMYYYVQGNIKYELFYSKWRWLISKHIVEQITYRINSMDTECFNDGQCKMCGCSTTALQMCNKACEKPCYPAMLSRKEWREAKRIGFVYDEETDRSWALNTKNLNFKKLWHGKAHI